LQPAPLRIAGIEALAQRLQLARGIPEKRRQNIARQLSIIGQPAHKIVRIEGGDGRVVGRMSGGFGGIA